MPGCRRSASSERGATRNPGHHGRVQGMYRDEIIEGMARRLWVFAWMNFVLEHESICPHCGGLGLRTERADGSVYWQCEECEREFQAETQYDDWDAAAPLTPRAARQAAEALAGLIQQLDDNDVLSLFEKAMLFDQGAYFEWDATERDEGGRTVLEIPEAKADLAYSFGNALASESLLPSDDFGAGFGAWARDHVVTRGSEVLRPELPRFRVELFDDNLNWSGEGKWLGAESGTLIDEATERTSGGTMRAQLLDYGADPTAIVTFRSRARGVSADRAPTPHDPGVEWRLQIDRDDGRLRHRWFRGEGRSGEREVTAAAIPVETREAMIRLAMRLWNARVPR